MSLSPAAGKPGEAVGSTAVAEFARGGTREKAGGGRAACTNRALVVEYLGRTPYAAALALQEELVTRKLEGDPYDYVLLVEHEGVFTLGRGAAESDLRGAHQRFGIPVYRVGRGGGVTYHGPGQLVVYPVVRLPAPDVRAYVRLLGDTIVRVCETFGVAAWLDEVRVGVWAARGKIASIGIGVRRWVAFHGLALNVSTRLEYFECIVPCRTPGLVVSSLEKESGHPVELTEVAVRFSDIFHRQWGVSPKEESINGGNSETPSVAQGESTRGRGVFRHQTGGQRLGRSYRL